MRTLFVTWDGPQTSYLEGLFLPIFSRLAKSGLDFSILQFTWGNAGSIDSRRRACAEAGFSYQCQTILRRPLAAGSLLTALIGARVIRKAIREHRVDAVMPRSTMPSLATLLALQSNPIPMILDADGLPLDELVDVAGYSSSSLIHRVLRDIEAQAVRRADVVLTRTQESVDILRARAGAGTSATKFFLVSNGRDTTVFTPSDLQSRCQTRARLSIDPHAPLLIYVGSIGPQYCLPEMLRLFALVRMRRPDAHFLVLTGSPESLTPGLEAFPDLGSFVSVLSVPASEVPSYISCADLGLALRRPSYSMQGIAPIKLGEYLLCGLPIVATNDIGNTGAIANGAGFLLDAFDECDLKRAADWFVSSVLPRRAEFSSQCRDMGVLHFSLDASATSYARAFAPLADIHRGDDPKCQ